MAQQNTPDPVPPGSAPPAGHGKVIVFSKRVLKIPYLFFAGVFAASIILGNWWPLAGIPMVYLGWVCSAPNLNLADGCLPQALMLLAVLLTPFFSSIFIQLAAICWCSWLACSLELAWRCETGRTGVKQEELTD